MALLIVDRTIENNVFKVKFSLSNVSNSEILLADSFGEPSYTFGGTFDPTSGAFLSRYFPDSKELIPDWVQFANYQAGAEVKFTDGTFYRALTPVTFSFPDWIQFQNYSAGSVVKYTDGKYYKAVTDVDFTVGSPNPGGFTITNWIEPGNVGAGDYVTGDIVVVTSTGIIYKAIQDSPQDWDVSTNYALGDIVFFDSTGTPAGTDFFYEAIVNAPRLGSYNVLTGNFTGTSPNQFYVGNIVTQAVSGAVGTVVSWDDTTKTLVLDTTSGEFDAINSISVTGIGSGSALGDGSGIPDTVEYSDPLRSSEWQQSNKANPGVTNSQYWAVYTNQDPGGSSWQIYVDQDPNVNTTIWQSFTPSGKSPSSVASFNVNKVTRFLISGLPIEFSFIGAEAENNAKDFAEVVKKDIDEIWDSFTAQMDGFSTQEVVDLNA